MATNQPVSRDDPDYAQSGYDPSKIESVRAADTRNDQSVRDWLHQNEQSVRDWLHQISQTTPESPDTVKYRLLAKTTRAMNPALVNADIRTPEQNTAILQRIYGDQPAPASTAVDTAKNIIQARAASPAITGQSGTATPATATPVTATPVTAAPVDRALTVAGQALPPISHIPGGSLAMFAQPHSGAQDQPLSTSSRSWTGPNMFPLSNPMPWGDDAPAGHPNTTPTVSTPTAPNRATAPAAAPTAPAQSSPGFFSGLFKDPYAGMSPKQMNVEAQKMQLAGDEAGANVLTQRADNAITSSDGSFAQGGSVDENHPVVQRAMHLVRSFLLNG